MNFMLAGSSSLEEDDKSFSDARNMGQVIKQSFLWALKGAKEMHMWSVSQSVPLCAKALKIILKGPKSPSRVFQESFKSFSRVFRRQSTSCAF